MYKHLLIATDGTEIAQLALKHGLQLAKNLGAKTTVITVTMPWTSVAFGIYETISSREAFEQVVQQRADALLKDAEKDAQSIGVPCVTRRVSDANPYQAILAAANDTGCDLIVVGSHGRRGLERLLLGSEAMKVLTHSKVPVLVCRE